MSYDRLIDETWVDGRRLKHRWTVKSADAAVEETVEAARYLSSQRERLAPRRLVLSCQGVSSEQYAECGAEVLSVARPGDWLGLGGWCILGRWKSWLPEFFRTIRLVVPMAANVVRRVHIFGVLWEPALAPLLWMCNAHGLQLSCDSAAPVLACTFTRSAKKAGVRRAYFRDNTAWWVEHLANLRQSRYYREPVAREAVRQLDLF